MRRDRFLQARWDLLASVVRTVSSASDPRCGAENRRQLVDPQDALEPNADPADLSLKKETKVEENGLPERWRNGKPVPCIPGPNLLDETIAMGVAHLDDRFHETDHGTGNLLAAQVISSWGFVVTPNEIAQVAKNVGETAIDSA